MFHLRTTKTASGSTAVQIVRYEKRKMVVVKHVGSTVNAKELQRLKQSASVWIERASKQPSLFSEELDASENLLKRYQYIGFRYGLLYESLYKLIKHFGFHWLRNKPLIDLVIARIVSPVSKLKSIEFLKEYMGKEYGRRELYRKMPIILGARDTVESKVLLIAKKEFAFDFSLVFYDVTTLYFESFEEDELRQCGFSKDNKINQPQIVLGLLVTGEGFPLGYQIFEGKRFEGHTLIPVILSFKRKHKIQKLTVVADAAMISSKNIEALTRVNLQYIVGARTASLSMKLIEQVSQKLFGHDGATMRVQTNYGDLICEFSQKRYVKDKREMEKQIARAEKLLKNTGNIKRAKFISSEGQSYGLNKSLIDKTRLLLGIKGYYTNLSNFEVSDRLIIEHYHNLWHVEQAFRISKSDLQIRPVYHYKQQSIEVHILICFMALSICKYMELKASMSIKSILTQLKTVSDAKLVDTISGEEFVLRSPISDEIFELLKKLELIF
jgi:transposase